MSQLHQQYQNLRQQMKGRTENKDGVKAEKIQQPTQEVLDLNASVEERMEMLLRSESESDHNYPPEKKYGKNRQENKMNRPAIYMDEGMTQEQQPRRTRPSENKYKDMR